MPRIAQKKARKGGQKWLQFLVDRDREFLNGLIRKKLRLDTGDTIDWLSPSEADSYAEYQDDDFLSRFPVELNQRSLSSFWPRRGPVWDGLARTSRGDILLVEAKSHASELLSSCRACPQALGLIRDSLGETAEFYQSGSAADWTERYYQYANRLAHLYLLRQLNGIPAWLIFIYFVNDAEMAGPKSVVEWHKAIDAIHHHLGVTAGQLGPYVVSLFPDVSSFVLDKSSIER